MQKPLSDLVISERHLALLQQILQAEIPNCTVWAYGSRVTGTGHSTSDLDLALHQCSIAQFTQLQNTLQNSLLPIIIDLHRWETLPESFKQNIKQQYIVIQ